MLLKFASFLIDTTRMKGNSNTMLSIFSWSQFVIKCCLYLKGLSTVVRNKEHRVEALSLLLTKMMVFSMNIAVSRRSIYSYAKIEKNIGQAYLAI